MSPPNLRELSALAERLADTARPIIRAYFRSDAQLTFKADQSPVTAADKEAESAMRAVIEAAQPDHGILGEEEAGVREDADYLWVLDPIDGTKNFACGSYQFGTLITLVHQGTPVIGVIDQPILNERWIGIAGEATRFNGEPASTRPCTGLGEAWMYSTTPDMFDGAFEVRFKNLSSSVKHALFGTDCYGYGLLAGGYTDIICEAQMNPWDYMAHIPIVEGAGGKITDWSGAPLTLESDGTVLAAGDADVHAAAVQALNG